MIYSAILQYPATQHPPRGIRRLRPLPPLLVHPHSTIRNRNRRQLLLRQVTTTHTSLLQRHLLARRNTVAPSRRSPTTRVTITGTLESIQVIRTMKSIAVTRMITTSGMYIFHSTISRFRVHLSDSFLSFSPFLPTTSPKKGKGKTHKRRLDASLHGSQFRGRGYRH